LRFRIQNDALAQSGCRSRLLFNVCVTMMRCSFNLRNRTQIIKFQIEVLNCFDRADKSVTISFQFSIKAVTGTHIPFDEDCYFVAYKIWLLKK
jgi:hypothetical protein